MIAKPSLNRSQARALLRQQIVGRHLRVPRHAFMNVQQPRFIPRRQTRQERATRSLT
jgi:hypothetical protein